MKTFSKVAKAVNIGLLASCSFVVTANDTSASTDDENHLDIERIEVVSKYHRDVGATGLPLAIGDTPQSISLVESDFMEFYDTQSVGEALQHSAGTYSEDSLGNRSRFVYSRGFSMNRYLIDGMGAAGRPYQTSMLDTSMFEQIEVIRGSTGMLQEVGQPSGTINLIQKRAGNYNGGSVSAELGSWDKRRVNADVNVAITDDGSVRARAVGVYESSEYFQDDVDNNRQVIYTTLSADITDKLSVNVFASYQADDQNNINDGVPYIYSNGNQVEADSSVNTYPEWAKDDTEQANYMLEGLYTINEDWIIQARLHHASIENTPIFATLSGQVDEDNGNFNYWVVQRDSEYTSDRAELTLNGKFELFGREQDINIGLAQTKFEEQEWTYNPSTPVVGNFYDPLIRSQPEPTFDYENGIERVAEQESQSARVAFNLNLVDNFSLLLGANHKKFDSYSYRGAATPSDIDVSDTSLYIGGVLSLGDKTKLYASYTDIFDLPQTYDINGELLDPLLGENVEVGIRFSSEDENITVDLAWFEISQDNYPTYQGQSPAGFGYYESADGVESQGYEVEINAYLTEQLSTTFAYTNLNISDPYESRITQIQPDEIATFNASYDFSGPLQGLRLGGFINYTGARNGFLRVNRVTTYIPMSSFTLVGLAASYEINEQLSVQANINNLLDKEYESKIAFSTVRAGEPRNYSVQLSYSF